MKATWTNLFVTGTDTEVGKTVTTACLAAAFRDAGGEVRALKPVASGVPPGTAGEDAGLLATAAGHVVPPGSVLLAAACAPERAARLEGRTVDLSSVIEWVAANTTRAGVTLVEGVGGWEVPMGPGWRVADLAEALGWPVLVVAADRLGVLNHVLLTVAAVRNRGLDVAGVVLARSENGANREDLQALLPGVPVACLGTLPSLTPRALAQAGRGVLAGLGYSA